jgi:hypothetical protein
MAATSRPAARKRATSARTTTSPEATTSSQPTCPECGRTFSRPAALGAHRSRVHGIAGTSQNARSRRNTAARTATATPARRTGTTPAPTTTGAPTRDDGGVNHDALLRALFPNGIPPRQDLIAEVNDWLTQADRLAGQR